MTSGIPQGSVLGPTLFVLYINDLPDSIQNNSIAVMFADDTKLFARTDTPKDKEKLQEDLDCVCKWSSLWLLKFHPDKCKVLSLGYKLDETPPTFNMVTNSEDGSANQVKLEATPCEKDIGVHVDDNLSFKDHIYTKIKKASAVMGIIRRTFDYLDQNMFLQLFKSLVRPLIETSVTVWAPYKKTDIAELEMVHRRATKQVPGLKHLEYSERLITRQIWGIWKLRPAYSPETPNLGQNRYVSSRVTLKFDGWPWKTIGHLFFAVSSFVQHSIAIGEFKLELQSGNAQFESNSTIFRAIWPWNLTDDLEKQ